MPERCFKCLKEIIPPTPISRHNDQCYHQNCFTCSICNKPIKETQIFPDLIRCLNCVEKHGPKCNKCNSCFKPKSGLLTYKKIPNNETYFHPECFVCTKCNQRLSDGFYEQDGILICISCNKEELKKNAKTCAKCNELVMTNFIEYLGQIFHKGCLKCILCAEVLDNRYYIFNEIQPLCELCNKKEKLKNARTCFKCTNLITDYGLSFLDRDYHENCLTCSTCNIVLKSSNLLTNSTKEPYCENCFTKTFAKKCFKCNSHINPILPVVSYDNNFFHKECLVCDICKNSVVNIAFYKQDSGIVCKSCKQSK